jgi:hypothetical protein
LSARQPLVSLIERHKQERNGKRLSGRTMPCFGRELHFEHVRGAELVADLSHCKYQGRAGNTAYGTICARRATYSWKKSCYQESI